MSAKYLSDADVIIRFSKLVKTERKITHLVLECIAEIDKRRLFLERAYPSLFEFLVKEYGYSPSAAVRRIDSARLLNEVPEMSGKIESGALNLSQLSKVQQAIRQVQKSEGRKLGQEEKQSLLQKIENTTQERTELILAQELSLPQVFENRSRIHRDESVTLTITFSRVQIALLNQAQDLVAHSVPNKNWSDVISYLAQKEVSRRTEIRRAETRRGQSLTSSIAPIRESSNSSVSAQTQERRSVQVKRNRKALRPNLKKALLHAGSSCQFKDPVTWKFCGATRFLQVDHIQPVWAGGDNRPENLQTLCSQHNRFKYRKETSIQPLRW